MYRPLLQSPAFVLAAVVAIPIAGLLLRFPPVWVLLAVVGTAAASVLLSIQQARWNALEWSDRPFQFDRAFLDGCEIDRTGWRARVALAVRASIADLATVPIESIHADDPFRGGIDTLPYWDSIDTLGFVLALQERLGEDVPAHLGDLVYEAYKDPETRVRDFVQRVVARLERRA